MDSFYRFFNFFRRQTVNSDKPLDNLIASFYNFLFLFFFSEVLEAKQQLVVVLEKGITDLAKILKENTKLPFHKITYFWMEMLYAVKQIHNNGIVHCDLKPSNFVMDHEGSIKLIDFGISCSIQNDMTSAIKTDCEGSLNYMSPEALSSYKSGDPKSPSFGKPQYKVIVFFFRTICQFLKFYMLSQRMRFGIFLEKEKRNSFHFDLILC